jgi:hypothetical protein
VCSLGPQLASSDSFSVPLSGIAPFRALDSRTACHWWQAFSFGGRHEHRLRAETPLKLCGKIAVVESRYFSSNRSRSISSYGVQTRVRQGALRTVRLRQIKAL